MKEFGKQGDTDYISIGFVFSKNTSFFFIRNICPRT
jgi:hypothetical protein